MSAIDTYLNKISEPQKTELERVQKIIAETVPDATEAISYGMPGYKYNGKYLITFAGFKDHMSLFPGSHAIEVMGNKLDRYKISKGTVQFTLENPLTESLVKEMLAIRVNDITTS